MIKRICDKCKKEEVLDNKELAERLQRYIRPSDKKTIDLCRVCIKNLEEKQKELSTRQLEEFCKLNQDLLG